MKVEAGTVVWAMGPSSKEDMLVKSEGEEFYVRLADAGKIDITPYDTGFMTGVKITLTRFRHNGMLHKGRTLDLTLYLTICLDGKAEELVMSAAANEREATVRLLDWPRNMDASDVDYTVLSNKDGVLLPRKWPKKYDPINVGQGDRSFVQSNLIECWSMSWWGFQKGGSAMIVIVETPDDAAYQFLSSSGRPHRHRPSLEGTTGETGLSAHGAHVLLCQSQLRRSGEALPALRDGLRAFRFAAGEGGAAAPGGGNGRHPPGLAEGAKERQAGESAVYDPKNPEKNYRLVTFDECAEKLRRWKAKGYHRLSVVLEGWHNLGYDRQHPDILPPAPAAGGWAAFKRFFDTSRELGYLAMVHDQYRDYYTDAPSWDPQFAIHEEDARTPAGGVSGHSLQGLEDRQCSISGPLGRRRAGLYECALHAGTRGQKLRLDRRSWGPDTGRSFRRFRLCSSRRGFQSGAPGHTDRLHEVQQGEADGSALEEAYPTRRACTTNRSGALPM